MKIRATQLISLALMTGLLNLNAMAQLAVVQILNGRNGKPIPKIRVWVSFDDQKSGQPLDLKTDSQGEVRFETNGAKTFRVSPVGTIACREQQFSAPIDYSVEEVLTTGIVTRNDCGRFNPAASHGRLIYIARPATWWELFKN
jgi:hypothetical protein